MLADEKKDAGSSKEQKGYLDRMGYDPDAVLDKTVEDELHELEDRPIERRPPGKGKKPVFRSLLVVIGIVMLLLSTIYAIDSITRTGTETVFGTEEYRLYREVLASPDLNHQDGPGTAYFKAGAVMSVQGPELKKSLVATNKEFQDYEFSIEILDVSDYPVYYNRSSAGGSAIESASLPDDENDHSITTFETAVNIFVDDDEIHTARFIMQVWKD